MIRRCDGEKNTGAFLMFRAFGCAAFFLWALTAPVCAQTGEAARDETAQGGSIVDELRVGVFAQGWGNIGKDKEQGVGFNLETAFVSPGFLSAVGSPRPHLGVTIASDSDATNQVYFGLEWQAYLKRRLFASISLGGAVHDGETKYTEVVDRPRRSNTLFLGCRALFRVAGDIGYDVSERVRLSVHMAHISNANLCSVNEGLDHFGARLGYRF